jgi:hypothetical protein
MAKKKDPQAELPGVLPDVVEHPDITKLVKQVKAKRAEWQEKGAELSKLKTKLIDKMREKLEPGEDGKITYITKHFRIEIKPGKDGVSIVDLAEEEADAA